MRQSRQGEITVITGPMFAGKTEELIRLVRRALYAKLNVQVFKSSIDTRFDPERVVTHLGVSHEATPVADVKQLVSLVKPDTDAFFIEECQFLDSRIVPLAQRLADKGKRVVLAGLDLDFRREPFGSVPELMAIADQVVKLKAICMNCGAPAAYTYRMIDGRAASYGDPVILIGASESYQARCRKCYSLRGRPNSANSLLEKLS